MSISKERQPMSLRNVFISGIAFSLGIIGICFSFFAWQAAGRKRFWLAGLDQDLYFSITRNAVTLAGALVVGVTIFFSYRKQQTAEKAQELAVEAQNMAIQSQSLASRTLRLSLDKHDLERVSELRDRYARSAEQLANEKEAIQLAGIHSLAALADDWIDMENQDEQQVCIALLCSFVSGTTLSSPVAERSPKTAAAEVILARIQSDLVSTNKSWSAKTLTISSAPVNGWHGATFTGGKHTYADCVWRSSGTRSLELRGGQLRILGNLSKQTFPRSIKGEFSGGRATLLLDADSANVARFYRSNFIGSAVSVRINTDARLILSFSYCQFWSGRLTLSYSDKAPKIIFRSCTFTPAEVVRLMGSYEATDFLLEDCTFSDGGSTRPYGIEEFLIHARVGTRPQNDLSRQPTLF